MSEKTRPSIILASTSPRRRKLLFEAGYKFRVVGPEVDESAFETEDVSPCEYASKLALAKAKSVAGQFGCSYSHCILIRIKYFEVPGRMDG